MKLSHAAICVCLLILALASCQDDNTRKLVEAINKNTAAIQAFGR